MKLSKKQREELRVKYGGRCAYCGHELDDRWQADHLIPVRRIVKRILQPGGWYKSVTTGEMENPEHDTLENMMPSCRACNNDKFSLSLEQWRRRLEGLVGVCQRNHSAFRHAERFGLVIPAPRKILFHFETYKPEIPCP